MKNNYRTNSDLSGALSNIRIVLSRPIYGGNIGAVCRAMSNMGLSDLAIAGSTVADMNEARKMACWADQILKSRREMQTLVEAISDCTLVMGATARQGLYRQHAKTPREWIPTILETAKTGKVALLFGPEDNGLNNDELALCSQLIEIPSCPEYRSLNLSHAVMICAYEIYTASGCFEPKQEKSPEATSILKERMFAMWEQTLLDIGFMKDDKAKHMMLGVRRIFSRGQLTQDDVRILMGIARQATWCAREMRKQAAHGLKHDSGNTTY